MTPIAKTMEEKVKPLLEAGKFSEAEPELDRVLEQLKPDGKSTGASPAPTHSAQDITEEVREKLAHNIGCSFLLFRTKVQGELKVTKEQKEKLNQHLRTLLPEAMQVLQKSNGERGKYNQKTHEETAAVLKEILNEGQRTRLHQLELQKDMLFGPAWNMKELHITEEQQKQFMAPTQEAQQKTQALMAEIHKGASPDVRSGPRRSSSAWTSKSSWRPCSRMPRKSSGRKCWASRWTRVSYTVVCSPGNPGR
jgi:hypothetical protein